MSMIRCWVPSSATLLRGRVIQLKHVSCLRYNLAIRTCSHSVNAAKDQTHAAQSERNTLTIVTDDEEEDDDNQSVSSDPRSLSQSKYIHLKKVQPNGSTPRFYTGVSVEQFPHDHKMLPSHYTVRLGGRLLRTPRDNFFGVPSLPLAWAIAQEWDSQITKIKPTAMPLMKLATTALDTQEEHRLRIFKELRSNARFDMAAIRVTAPPRLVRLQAKHLDPLVEWAAAELKLNLTPQFSLTPVEIDAQTAAEIENILNSLDRWRLAAFDIIGATTKSFLIALAVLHRFLDVESAVKAARVDEQYGIKINGEIRDVHHLDTAFVRLQIASARTFFDFLDLETLRSDKTPQ